MRGIMWLLFIMTLGTSVGLTQDTQWITMNETLECHWSQCTSVEGTGNPLTGCWKYGHGSSDEMARNAMQLADQKGNLFFSECVRKGVKPSVDWNRRVTGVPFPRGKIE